MGDYFDIVCEEHKAIIRLWKAYDLMGDLGASWDTFAEFEIKPEHFKLVIRERPLAKRWLEKHKACKLLLGNSENFRDKYDYDKFEVTEGQTPISCVEKKVDQK